MKSLAILAGILVLAFGAGCLNYTTFGGADHHREWAEENDLPAPSREIFFAGLLCTALGSGAVGFALGRPKRR